MKNYKYEQESLYFKPFHEDNDDCTVAFTYIETDLYKDKGERLLRLCMDEHDENECKSYLEMTLEEAQAKQLRDFLNKYLGD